MSVFDLYEELRAIVRALNDDGVRYALCGGLAVGVHGEARATKDIDILVHPDELERVKLLIKGLGFSLEAAPMEFSGGLQLQRVSKIEDGQLFTVDLLLVTEALKPIWEDRQRLTWGGGDIWVVSRGGLIAMKRLAGRPQDLVDIEKLGGTDA